jgi:hypothetical protein
MSPILKGIAIIGRHPLKSHTILIDDRRQFDTVAFAHVTERQIQAAIRAINPAYVFSYETGSEACAEFVDDVLAVVVK